MSHNGVSERQWLLLCGSHKNEDDMCALSVMPLLWGILSFEQFLVCKGILVSGNCTPILQLPHGKKFLVQGAERGLNLDTSYTVRSDRGKQGVLIK